MVTTKGALVLALLLVALLVEIAVFQAMRVVQPAAILPGLTAIEGAVAQLNPPNSAGPALRQARAALELAIADSSPKAPGGPSLQELKNAAANLAIAEN